jgi:hypothetical protein
VLHPPEDPSEHPDGLDHVRARAQHHALGPLGEGDVADLRPRGDAGPREPLEHLRRPDDRRVNGGAQREDVLLYLGRPLPAALHGEVAARDHEPERRTAHRRQQELRQALDSAAGLDREHGGDPLSAVPVELGAEVEHVLGPLDEGQPDHVGVAGDEGERAAVGRGRRGDAEVGVGQVDALVRSQAVTAGRGPGDDDLDPLAPGPGHDARHPPVVEPGRVADLEPVEGRGHRAPDPRRMSEPSVGPARHRPVGAELTRPPSTRRRPPTMRAPATWSTTRPSNVTFMSGARRGAPVRSGARPPARDGC